jgi:hypothetical protein
MAPTTPQDPALSVVSKKWDADNKGFLTDEERALRNLDTEGTGTLTAILFGLVTSFSPPR